MGFSESVADRPQQLLALDRANRVRRARAEAKRRIAGGEITAVDVILSDRWEFQTMAVADVLGSQPGWGARRTLRLLAGLSLPEAKTIGSMTVRQRTAVASRLAC